MIAPETREIDGVLFQVGGLELKKEREVLVRLTKMLGPAMIELARMGAGGGVSLSGSQVLAGLDDAEIDYLVETFRKITQAQVILNEDKVAWMPCVDAMFKGGAISQLKWLWFCLEHQFAGFLGSGSGKFEAMLEGLLTRLKAKASPSTSPQT